MLLQCPPVAVAVAKIKQDGQFENVTNKIEFNLVELCDLMGWDSSPVKKELKLLEWNLGLLMITVFSYKTARIVFFLYLLTDHFVILFFFADS